MIILFLAAFPIFFRTRALFFKDTIISANALVSFNSTNIPFLECSIISFIPPTLVHTGNTPHAITQDSQGRLLVADLVGGNFHDYMTVPGQIEEHRTRPDPAWGHRIQRLDPDGQCIDEWTHIMPLSLASYGKRIYASDKMSNLAILDEDSGEVLQRVDDIAIYIHQLAMDSHGDLYTASVYPEHAGEKRGPEGPSHHRWTQGALA